MLRARLGWTRRSHGDISSRAHAVYGGMKKHVTKFPNPPVELEDLKAQLDRFDRARSGSMDRGRKAFAELKSARKVLTHSLDHLGHYVEAESKEDVATFILSGFEVAGGGRTSNEACPIPRMLSVRQGRSGELIAAWTPLYRKANHYELRWGRKEDPPETWKVDKTHSGQTARPHPGPDPRHNLRLPGPRVRKKRQIYRLEQRRLEDVHLEHAARRSIIIATGWGFSPCHYLRGSGSVRTRLSR
jgi:hypothetical protein